MSDALRDRGNYHWFMAITTRWMDNDIYGHINNVAYYSYFDTVANRYLIEEGGLDIHQGNSIGYVVRSECHYKSAVAFPDALEGGLRVNRLGTSSVEYGIAIFRKGENRACAYGTFTHVFVDPASERPVAIGGEMRKALERLMKPDEIQD